MQQLVILLLIDCSPTCFGRLYARHQQVRPRFTAYVFLSCCSCCDVEELGCKLCALCGVGCLTGLSCWGFVGWVNGQLNFTNFTSYSPYTKKGNSYPTDPL